MNLLQAIAAVTAFNHSVSIDIVIAGAGLAGERFISDRGNTIIGQRPVPQAAGPAFAPNEEGAYYTSIPARHYLSLSSTCANSSLQEVPNSDQLSSWLS